MAQCEMQSAQCGLPRLPVVGENPPEVRVVGEVDPEHVPQLTLVPVSGLTKHKTSFFVEFSPYFPSIFMVFSSFLFFFIFLFFILRYLFSIFSICYIFFFPYNFLFFFYFFHSSALNFLFLNKTYLKYIIDRVYGREFVRVGFNPDPGIEPEGEKVVHNLKPGTLKLGKYLPTVYLFLISFGISTS